MVSTSLHDCCDLCEKVGPCRFPSVGSFASLCANTATENSHERAIESCGFGGVLRRNFVAVSRQAPGDGTL
jgi:hypothetical protein